MIYIIFIISVLTAVMLIKFHNNSYAYGFLLIITGLAVAITASVFKINSMLGYRYPRNSFFYLDYYIYLRINNMNISTSMITRVFNIGVAIHNFGLVMIMMDFIKKKSSRHILIAAAIAFGAIFTVYYDCETGYYFYVWLVTERFRFLEAYIRITDIALKLIQLISPMFLLLLLIREFFSSRIWFKNRRILTLAVIVTCIEMLYIGFFLFGPLSNSYFKSGRLHDNLLGVFRNAALDYYYYAAMTVISMIFAAFIFFSIIKYKTFDTVVILKNKKFKKYSSEIKNEIFNSFHSVKNTFFNIKILAEQGKNAASEEQKDLLLQKIYNISNTNMENLINMMSTFNDVRINEHTHSITECIESALSAAVIPDNIIITRNYPEESTETIFDYHHMFEVFSNVIKNAVEAIRLANCDNGEINIEIILEDYFLIINFTDNGIGMNKEVKKNIFKPLYTTKSRQTNWGMGLFYVYKAVTAHHGFVNIKTQENKGTTISIVLLAEPNKE